MTMMPADKRVPKLLKRLRVLWFVTKNCTEGRKLHASYLSLTSSRVESCQATDLEPSASAEEHALSDFTPVSHPHQHSSDLSHFFKL
jgi:hypothetical protein